MSPRLLPALAFVTLCALAAPGILHAVPSWWTTSGVLTGNGAEDYATVNQGQVKFIATKARDYFNAKLPGGAGPDIEAMVAGWEQIKTATGDAQGGTQDYAAVNVGQLKNVAAKFYVRLAAVGIGTGVPWTATTSDDNDYGLANIGQVKALFDFDLLITGSYNTDDDQLPDSYEVTQFGSIGAQKGSDDYDGDGISNVDEYVAGSNPKDFYNGVAYTLAITQGQNQSSGPGEILPTALVVRVTDSLGAPKANAPVTFKIPSGGTGSLTLVQSVLAATYTEIVLKTDPDGYVSNAGEKVFFKQPSQTGTVSTVTVQVGSVTGQFTAESLGLVGRWALDSSSGTTAADTGPRNNPGTLSPSGSEPTWSTGVYGNGLTFDGTNDYVNMGNPSNRSLDFGQSSFTISFWFKFTVFSPDPIYGGERIISKGHHGWNPGYLVGVQDLGSGQVAICAGIGSTQYGVPAEAVLVYTTTAWNDGNWHQVVTVFDQVLKKGRIYIDGTAQPLAKISGSGGTVSGSEIDFSGLTNLSATRTDQSLTISGHSLGTIDLYKGSIDDLRIELGAMSPERITQLGDNDADGLPDWQEKLLGTNPTLADTDSDGMPDGYEYSNGLNPLVNDASSDLDGDGIINSRDARPNSSGTGQIQINISTPANGSTL